MENHFLLDDGKWYVSFRDCKILHFVFVDLCPVQIPKFIVTQVRQQNMESQRKQNKERAVRKLLKKITTEKPSDKVVPEVGISVLEIIQLLVA